METGVGDAHAGVALAGAVAIGARQGLTVVVGFRILAGCWRISAGTIVYRGIGIVVGGGGVGTTGNRTRRTGFDTRITAVIGASCGLAAGRSRGTAGAIGYATFSSSMFYT